jgi:hypothetical protein
VFIVRSEENVCIGYSHYIHNESLNILTLLKTVNAIFIQVISSSSGDRIFMQIQDLSTTKINSTEFLPKQEFCLTCHTT